MAAVSSKTAAAYLLGPLNAPEPAEETGLGTSFRSTFAPAEQTSPSSTSSTSNNPFRDGSVRRSPSAKNNVSSSTRPVGSGSPRQPLPDVRGAIFEGESSSRRRSSSQGQGAPLLPSYADATSPSSKQGHRRRTSSLKERFPGDTSHQPLDAMRRASKKADRSPHLKKKHLPGTDMIDRLDPTVGGRPYHHDGPFDAALLARNTSYEHSPVAALKTTNEEALKATPQENIRDAVERHVPLDGVAVIPPGVPDRFGRTYEYEEGADLQRETNADGPGYKRWAGKDYDDEDLKGQAEPTFSLDRALRTHTINDNGIEMTDHAAINKTYKEARRRGTLDNRDPVQIAGGESSYVDMELANTTETDVRRSGSLREGLKKRIGSLRRKKADD